MLCLSSSEGVAQTNLRPDGFEHVSNVARQTLPSASMKNVAKPLCINIVLTNAYVMLNYSEVNFQQSYALVVFLDVFVIT